VQRPRSFSKSTLSHTHPPTPIHAHITDDHSAITKKSKADPNYTEFNFKLRTVYEVIDLPMDWPVEINYHEAKAFCRWKGDLYRLPTEAEFALMRTPPAPGTEGTVKSEIIYHADVQANINLK
jgi:hypothetical protein